MKRLIKKAKNIIMYHGTRSENVKEILKSGYILPSNESGFYRTEGHTVIYDNVYLTKEYSVAVEYSGLYYCGVDYEYGDDGWATDQKDYPCVIHVNIDNENTNLIADEDYINYTIERNNEYQLLKDAIDYAGFTEDEYDEFRYDPNKEESIWFEYVYEYDKERALKILKYIGVQKSFDDCGSLGYTGKIPLSQIEQIDILDEDENKYIVKDLSLQGLMNVINTIE